MDDACILAVLVDVLFESLAGSEPVCNEVLLDSDEDTAAEVSGRCVELGLVGTAVSIEDVWVEMGVTDVSIAPTVVDDWCSWNGTDGTSSMCTSSVSGSQTLSGPSAPSDNFSKLLEIEKL